MVSSRTHCNLVQRQWASKRNSVMYVVQAGFSLSGLYLYLHWWRIFSGTLFNMLPFGLSARVFPKFKKFSRCRHYSEPLRWGRFHYREPLQRGRFCCHHPYSYCHCHCRYRVDVGIALVVAITVTVIVLLSLLLLLSSLLLSFLL